jgi:hypothetical protein
MVHIELSTDDAALVRVILDDKLLELRKEINRTDSLAFKVTLRTSEHALERLVAQLPGEGADEPAS